MTALMRITERRVAEVTILQLDGRLELDNGDTVLRDYVNRLVEEGRINLVLDLTDVVRMDSAGIGMLVGKYLTVKRRGGTIKLVHVTTRTSRLLNITKLASVFEIYEREDQALQSFGVTV